MRFLEYALARLLLGTPAAGRVLDLAIPRLRRVALDNLRRAGYEQPDVIADGVFRSLSRVIEVFARFPQLAPSNIGDLIRYEGLDNFTDAMARGKGVLVATAHLGNWELSAFAHAWMTGPMNIVVRPLDNRRLDALVEQYRGLSGNRIIRKKEAARDILRALHAGEAVGILIDQNSSIEEGVFVDFFGRKACANAAFVKFAHRTGAAVAPGFALWEEQEQKYVLRFYPEVPMSGDVVADTQRVHSAIEAVIRQYPDQWLWIHRRWKTQPPEA